MLTFFTTAKPFRGHNGIIQKNALKSWTLLRPDVEVILFGDEEGAAETARDLGLRHESQVERNEFGTKRLDFMFCRAQAITRHDLLCYINCDILLTQDFCAAVKRVREKHSQFRMVGRRREIEITLPLSLGNKDWESLLRRRVLRNGRQRGPEWIDYFVFSRGLYGQDMPSFVVGRVFWDNWLVWQALASNHPVIDASDAILAVHQNHDYGYHPQGKDGVFNGAEAERNCEAPGRWKYFRHLASHPWTYGEIMTRRHRVYSYMRACSALVLGYHHLHLCDDARKKGKEWMASSSEKTLVALPSKAKAATATKS